MNRTGGGGQGGGRDGGREYGHVGSSHNIHELNANNSGGNDEGQKG